MTSDKTGDGLRGLTTRLLVLLLGMVIAGFVIPSPGVGAAPPPRVEHHKQTRPSLYRPMKHPQVPTGLVVPSLDVRAPIVPIELEGHTLTPPNDYREVGWWTGSARPGGKRGQTVITGHTVHTGGGVMDKLGEIRPGALVLIQTRHATMTYQATRVIVYTKAELAENATDLFRQNRINPRLVLITCTGWTGSFYTSNVVVFAKPLGVRKNPPRPVGTERG